MQDNTYIWKYLSNQYPDEHVAIYLYVCGGIRSSNHSIQKIMCDTSKIFCPPLSEKQLVTIVTSFLDVKKKQYIMGEIKIKPIYF